MADHAFASIDQLLGESLKRVAEPGDPAGVAELIRARVAGGDTGTPSNGGEFTSGGPGSGWPWLPWTGGALAVAIVGGTIGATGVFGILAPPEVVAGAEALAPSLSVSHVASGLDCPGGTPVVGFHPGDRVLAVARSDDSSHLAVRSPFDRADTVWLPVSSLVLDEGQGSIDSLEVDGCDEPVITLLPPIVAPEPKPEPPAPKPKPPAPPAPDTTKPVLGTPSGVQNIGCAAGYPGKPETTTISVSATDNKAVTGVSISWTGAASGSGQMSKSGSTWTFTYNPPDTTFGNVTFTMVARDAAANQSPAKQFVVNVDCLI